MFTGRSFARLRDLLAPGRSYAEINRQMAAVGPEFTGLPLCIGASIMDSRKGSILPWGGIFFPLPFGEYAPLTLLRAALESAAFAVRANLEQLERVSGQAFTPDTPLVIGGGAAQGFWPQLVADSLRKKVVVAREAEVSGLGAAMCAATGAALYPDLPTAARSMAHTGKVLEPRPIGNLEQLYRRWRSAYEGLAGLNLS
jgi:sugar (pentulose or hexulose) kinase